MAISEPVGGDLASRYVAADQDLYWLAEHGDLPVTGQWLRQRRRLVEQGRQEEMP